MSQHSSAESISVVYLTKAVTTDSEQLSRAAHLTDLGEMELLQGIADLAPAIDAGFHHYSAAGHDYSGVFCYEVIEANIGPKILSYALRRHELPAGDLVQRWTFLALTHHAVQQPTVSVCGNHGTLLVRRDSGLVLRYPEPATCYQDIERFDVLDIDDFCHTDIIDVLDLSYVTRQGFYEACKPKRDRCREALGDE